MELKEKVTETYENLIELFKQTKLLIEDANKGVEAKGLVRCKQHSMGVSMETSKSISTNSYKRWAPGWIARYYIDPSTKVVKGFCVHYYDDVTESYEPLVILGAFKFDGDGFSAFTGNPDHWLLKFGWFEDQPETRHDLNEVIKLKATEVKKKKVISAKILGIPLSEIQDQSSLKRNLVDRLINLNP